MNTISAHYTYHLSFNEEEGHYNFLPVEIFGSSPYLDRIFSNNIIAYHERWSNNCRKRLLKFKDPLIKRGNTTILFKSYDTFTQMEMLEVPDNINDCILYYHNGSNDLFFVVYKDAKERKEAIFNRWEDDIAYEISDYITGQLNA